MARTPSTMLPLGTPAPAFALPDPDGKIHSLEDFSQPALLVMFICNHCPFVKHVRHELAAIGRDYPRDRLGIIAINSNDIEAYPDDGPEPMRREAAEVGYTFPYVLDATQEVAKAYHAACTPDFYLFGPIEGGRRLIYRGQLDDSRPGNNIPVTGRDLRKAIDTLLSGGEVPEEQRPSLGCNIKWRGGNEPEYFTAVKK
jgi:thiol-disulfide isomerase/thioredoxin